MTKTGHSLTLCTLYYILEKYIATMVILEFIHKKNDKALLKCSYLANLFFMFLWIMTSLWFFCAKINIFIEATYHYLALNSISFYSQWGPVVQSFSKQLWDPPRYKPIHFFVTYQQKRMQASLAQVAANLDQQLRYLYFVQYLDFCVSCVCVSSSLGADS